MSKIFRLHTEGASTYKGWNASPVFPYNSKARETISDPDGANAKKQITSIPSPFARIDLVKTAFREVNRMVNGNSQIDIRQLDGHTIFHRMVSDSLDVGEIFFNIDKLSGKVEIITCDCNEVIRKLKSNTDNVNHQFVADSLEKFMASDAKMYNFAQMRNIYLLNYKNGPGELNIIGATSPATIFFSSANNLRYIKDIYFANNDKPFDFEFQPLYKRDFEFVKAWFALRKSHPNFSSLFPEIDEYLELTFRALSQTNQTNKAEELRNLNVQTLSGYSEIDVTGSQANRVEVLGINLLKKKVGMTSSGSEFTIKPELSTEEKLPLVLPTESGNKYANLQYVNGAWGAENKAPCVDEKSLQERTLPFDGFKYPYLTISDFLEDSIIRVGHIMNSKEYFDGNIYGNTEPKSYLLPIKPLYFKYFSADTLKSTMPDGKDAIEMEVIAGGSISLTLRIPIVGNKEVQYIEYRRLYYNNRRADVKKNEGGITEMDFTGFVMPGVKFQQDADAYYTVASVTPFSVQTKMLFYKGHSVVRDVPMDCRNQQKGVNAWKAETYTLEHKTFDFIRIAYNNEHNGLLIPSFPEHHGLDTYEFAVDLGTSNTHIEMKKESESQSTALAYGDAKSIISSFFVPQYADVNGARRQVDLDIENPLIETDFVPFVMGGKSDYSFPTRTALSYAKCINWNTELNALGLLNFAVTYDKTSPLDYNSEMVNIKWSNKSNAQQAMQLYIENLLLIIRNKVAVSDGDLQKTKITWFYPSSMSNRRLTLLRGAWNEAYNKYFSSTGETNSESESVAPIQFYFRRYSTATDLVNVDIGGGTTDIAFSENGSVKYITSFRFATNALFEDSFSDINPSNGIIDYFKDDMLKLLEETSGCNDLVNIWKGRDGHPADMASFLFSLKDNHKTKNIAKNKIDFSVVLQHDENFKIVFIIFYTAIIYHVAQIVKTKNLNMPRHIAFSGNGSKIIKVLTSDTKILSAYTKTVFEKVMNKPYGIELDILGFDKESSPKEATCKGGLLPLKQQGSPEMVVLKDSFGALIESTDTYASIDEQMRKQIVDGVEKFFNFVLCEIPSAFNFDDNFGVTVESINRAKDECLNDLNTFLNKGIDMSLGESGNNDVKIEETLLFYPIKGVIQALSASIEEYSHNA